MSKYSEGDFVSDRHPRMGEIWEDAEGTLYCSLTPETAPEQKWAAFLNGGALDHRFPTITKPMRLMFNNEGEYLGGDVPLRYPQKSNIRQDKS